MADQNNHTNPVFGIFCTIVSWLSVTLTITLQNIDVILRIVCSIIAIVTGILGAINWYWSIKKNKNLAKKNIPFH